MAKKTSHKKEPAKKAVTHEKKHVDDDAVEAFHDVAIEKKKKKHKKKSFLHKKNQEDNDHVHAEAVLEEPASDHKEEETERSSRPTPQADFHMSKEAKQRISAGIESIYQDSDGSVPDLSTFQSNKRGRLIRSFISFIISVGILGGVVYAGLFMLQPTGEFVENDVILSVSGEQEITAGEEVRYRIRYRNAQDAGLHKVSLEVRYPAGFVFGEATVAPAEDTINRWNLGELQSGDSGYIDVSGHMFGDLHKAQSFRSFLTYTPDGFSTEFQKATTLSVNTASSPATLSATYPEIVAGGVEVPVQITVTPKENVHAEHLYVEILGSGMFVKKTAAPASDHFEELRWSIDQLNEPYILSLGGIFVSPDGIEKELQVPVQLVGYTNAQREGDAFIYATTTLHVRLQDTEVSVTPVVNGATKDLTVQPGEKLHISIAVRNQSDVALENVRVRTIIDGPSFDATNVFDWANVEDELEGSIVGEQISKTIRRGILTHTSTQVPAFRNFGFGSQEILDFQLPIKSAKDIHLASFPPEQATLTVEMQYTLHGEQIILSSSPITMTLNSDVALHITDDISSTNNPEDTHTVTWMLSNSFHPLKNVTVKAEIFGLTEMVTSTAPVGTVAFDETSKELEWKIPDWPIEVPSIPVQFTLYRSSPNPSQTQLMSRVELRATDTVTGKDIIIVGDELRL